MALNKQQTRLASCPPPGHADVLGVRICLWYAHTYVCIHTYVYIYKYIYIIRFLVCLYIYSCVYMYLYIRMCVCVYVYTYEIHIHTHMITRSHKCVGCEKMHSVPCSRQLVFTIGRLLEITGLFCRISSLLQGSFAKETYHLKEPTRRCIRYHAVDN